MCNDKTIELINDSIGKCINSTITNNINNKSKYKNYMKQCLCGETIDFCTNYDNNNNNDCTNQIRLYDDMNKFCSLNNNSSYAIIDDSSLGFYCNATLKGVYNYHCNIDSPSSDSNSLCDGTINQAAPIDPLLIALSAVAGIMLLFLVLSSCKSNNANSQQLHKQHSDGNISPIRLKRPPPKKKFGVLGTKLTLKKENKIPVRKLSTWFRSFAEAARDKDANSSVPSPEILTPTTMVPMSLNNFQNDKSMDSIQEDTKDNSKILQDDDNDGNSSDIEKRSIGSRSSSKVEPE